MSLSRATAGMFKRLHIVLLLTNALVGWSPFSENDWREASMLAKWSATSRSCFVSWVMSIIKRRTPLATKRLATRVAYVRVRNHKNDASTSRDCQGGSYKTVVVSIVTLWLCLQSQQGLLLAIQQERWVCLWAEEVRGSGCANTSEHL